MGKSLVIVESPAKARTISKILGNGFEVIPSMGHIVDLPRTKMGVDIENNFKPSFIVTASRKKTLSQIKKEARGAEKIYLATDPDREGEAIAWNIKDKLDQKKEYLRVVFHEITPQAIKDAFASPSGLNHNKVNAQTGRRVLDRLVGYLLSPLLWRKVAGGLSAGRVQSVALRLIVERERQIQGFVPQEYWEIEARLKKIPGPGSCLPDKQAGVPDHFIAKLDKIEDKNAELKEQAQAEAIVEDLKGKQFVVSSIKEAEKRKNPFAPFITSTLQQDAFYKLRFSGAKTMLIAQQLYEGIELGNDEAAGLITYMRTDSVNVAQSAIREARDFIRDKFGKEYLPDEPNIYKSKKQAQEAHEAIRPTSVLRAPETLKGYLSPEQLKLYTLIYNRFLASQMRPALYAITSAEILAGKYLFRASGSRLVFKGFNAVYESGEEADEERKGLPPLKKDEVLDLAGLEPSQHFTKPPPRFSEASLVKTLEEEGIGRPSTYAPTIQTIIYRDYVRRIKGYLHPAELGFKVNDLLVEYFSEVMDVKFTANMEEELDEIEEGRLAWEKVINDFYSPFKGRLDYANETIQKEVVATDEICSACGKPMVVKWSRKGRFLSCSDFPNCRYAKSITTGIKCPQDGCPGELIERRSRRGLFYGCTGYPKCTYTARTLPEQAADKTQSQGPADG